MNDKDKLREIIEFRLGKTHNNEALVADILNARFVVKTVDHRAEFMALLNAYATSSRPFISQGSTTLIKELKVIYDEADKLFDGGKKK